MSMSTDMNHRLGSRGTATGNGPRERMIRTASRLFRRQGYASTSLSEVVEKSQAPRGSIYHHFPGGKEELAREAIALAARGVQRQIRQLAGSAREPGQLVRLLFSAFSHALEKSDFREGCPLATLALGWSVSDVGWRVDAATLAASDRTRRVRRSTQPLSETASWL